MMHELIIAGEKLLLCVGSGCQRYTQVIHDGGCKILYGHHVPHSIGRKASEQRTRILELG